MLNMHDQVKDYDKKKFETFRYFLTCYYFQGQNYSDMSNLAKEFKNSEKQLYTEKFIKELEDILGINDWERVKTFIEMYGDRIMQEDKIKDMVGIILKTLKED